MMANLNEIPNEILLDIIMQIPNASLPAVALTSRRLHKCATPKLYRFINYIEPDYEFEGIENIILRYRFDLPQSIQYCHDHLHTSRVYSIPFLLRTAKESPHLRSQIIAASFDFGQNRDRKNECALISLLVPLLIYLHITPFKFEANDSRLIKLFPVTSLDLRCSSGAYSSTNPKALNRLYDAFSTPTLRRLLFDGIPMGTSLGRAHTSAVSYLTLPNYSSAPQRLVLDMISWPKRLQFLSISNLETGDPDASLLDFMRKLNHNQPFLQELFIDAATHDKDHLGMTLRDFSNLRRLQINKDLILPPHKSKISLSKPPECELFECLPPKLEELELSLKWKSTWDHTETLDSDLSFEVTELLTSLTAIAANKPHSYPNLRKLVLKDNCSIFGFETVEPYDQYVQRSREQIALLNLLDIFGDAGIQLVLWRRKKSISMFTERIYPNRERIAKEACLREVVCSKGNPPY